jgi:hypothetical protein
MDKIEEILDVLAERRDYHATQANEFLDRAQGFAQVNAMRDLSEASTAAERHNFAAASFGSLLRKFQ